MLKDILNAREERWKRRCELAEEYERTVMTVTMNIPGSNKTLKKYSMAHKKFIDHLFNVLENKKMSIVFKDIMISFDGPVAFIVTTEDARKVKELAISIEQKHPIGRVLDIDIMDSRKRIYSRVDMCQPERQCLVCNESARKCIVEKKHSLKEVLDAVNVIIDKYMEQDL